MSKRDNPIQMYHPQEEIRAMHLMGLTTEGGDLDEVSTDVAEGDDEEEGEKSNVEETETGKTKKTKKRKGPSNDKSKKKKKKKKKNDEQTVDDGEDKEAVTADDNEEIDILNT